MLMMPTMRRQRQMDQHGGNMHVSETKSASYRQRLTIVTDGGVKGGTHSNQATQDGAPATPASEQYKSPRVVKCMNLMWTDLEEQKEGEYQP